MSLATLVMNMFRQGSGGVTPPPATEHWYKVAEEGETVSVTGTCRWGVPGNWYPEFDAAGTVVATSANLGGTYDSVLTKQLQCNNAAYASRNVKIMPLGDSITAANNNAGWRVWMNFIMHGENLRPWDFVGNAHYTFNNANYDADHNGYSGYAPSSLLNSAGSGSGGGPDGSPPYWSDARDIDDWFDGQAPDIVICHFGTNDLAAPGVSPTTILAGVSLLLARARTENPNVKWVMAQIIPISDSVFPGADSRVQAYNAAVLTWAATNTTGNSPILVVDQYTGFDVNTMTGDGVHPNSTGAQQMATRFLAAIDPYISNTIRGYNTTKFDYFAGNYPFINVMKVFSGWWHYKQDGVTPFTLDADGYPTDIAPGDEARCDVCFVMDKEGGYFPPGDYEVTCNEALTMRVSNYNGVSQNYLTNVTTGTGRITFTALDAAHNWDQFELSISFKNNTGGTIHMTEPVCCKVSERAIYNAGQIGRPAWLADYYGCKVIRFFDWEGLNGEEGDYFRWFSDIRNTKTRATYAHVSGQPCPVAVMGQMAIEMNAQQVHVNLPVCDRYNRIKLNHTTKYLGMVPLYAINNYNQNGGTGFDDTSMPLVPHGYVEDEEVEIDSYQALVAELAPLQRYTSYFVHVVDSTHFQLKATSGGAIITLTGGSSGFCAPPNNDYCFIGSADIDPINDYLIPLAQAWQAVAPNLTYKVTTVNERWNYQVPGAYDPGVGSYIASGKTTHVPTGGNRGYSQGLALLQAWYAFEQVFNPSQIIRMPENQAAGWSNPWSTFWDYVDPGIISPGSTVSQILSASLSRAEYSTAPYLYLDLNVGDYGSTALRPDAIWNAGYTTGSVPDSWWDSHVQNALDEVTIQMDGTNSFAQSKVPGIKLTTYECGFSSVYLGNSGFGYSSHGPTFKCNTMIAWKNWLDGPDGGLDMYTAYIQMFKDRGFTALVHLAGPWQAFFNPTYDAYSYNYFGLHDAQDNPSARFDLWQTI